jgi:hypothetical protein
MMVETEVTGLLMDKSSMAIIIVTGRQRGNGEPCGGAGEWKRGALRLSKHSLTKSITSSQLDVWGSFIVVVHSVSRQSAAHSVDVMRWAAE